MQAVPLQETLPRHVSVTSILVSFHRRNGKGVCMKPIWKICLAALLLAANCHGSEDWVITKDGGAYRVNGWRLMANGRLIDNNGTTAKTLTRHDLDEIGIAIDRYEVSHASPYARPAMAGPSKPAAFEKQSRGAPGSLPLAFAAPPEGPTDSLSGMETEHRWKRDEEEHPGYMGVTLVLIMFEAVVLLGIGIGSPGLSVLSACMWLGLVVLECKIHGDQFIGAFWADTMMLLFASVCFMVASFLLRWWVKMVLGAFTPEGPRR